jgi:hypothetical protein
MFFTWNMGNSFFAPILSHSSGRSKKKGLAAERADAVAGRGPAWNPS